MNGTAMKVWQLPLIGLIFAQASLASVTSFLNQNPANKYTDPYRKISRQGDNLEQVIIDEINSAKKSVFIAVQELRLPLVAQALINKKKAGIDVRIVLEHDYNFSILSQADVPGSEDYEASKLTELWALVDLNENGKIEPIELQSRDAIYMLGAAKVPVMDDAMDSSKGSGLMHHKFVVVDEKVALISSANFTLSCIHGDILNPASRGNPNSMVRIDSPEVAKFFAHEFYQLWGNGKRGNFGQRKTYRGAQSAVVDGKKITVQFSPTSRKYNWGESVNGLIGSHLANAKESIKAALFVFSDQRLADVLQHPHESGATMNFLVEQKFAFRDYSELLDLLGLQMFNEKCEVEEDNNPWSTPIIEGGVPALPRGDVLHHKFAVIDDHTTVIGSQNWSEAANHINDETLIVIEDHETATHFTAEYDRLRQKSTFGPSSKVQAEINRRSENCSQR